MARGRRELLPLGLVKEHVVSPKRGLERGGVGRVDTSDGGRKVDRDAQLVVLKSNKRKSKTRVTVEPELKGDI